MNAKQARASLNATLEYIDRQAALIAELRAALEKSSTILKTQESNLGTIGKSVIALADATLAKSV